MWLWWEICLKAAGRAPFLEWTHHITWSACTHSWTQCCHAYVTSREHSYGWTYKAAFWIWNTCKWRVKTQMAAIESQIFKRQLTIPINLYYPRPHGTHRRECLTQLTTKQGSTINLLTNIKTSYCSIWHCAIVQVVPDGLKYCDAYIFRIKLFFMDSFTLKMKTP